MSASPERFGRIWEHVELMEQIERGIYSPDWHRSPLLPKLDDTQAVVHDADEMREASCKPACRLALKRQRLGRHLSLIATDAGLS